jgi:hypothetical protein
VSDGALAALSQVLPPPAEPATGEATWDEIAVSMGVRFPGELRALIDTYGFGMIGRELTIFSPRSASFEEATAPVLRAMRELGPEECNSPLPAFPDAGPSLLPVAGNGNADYVFVVVTDGVADESRLWVGNTGDLDWLLVPGPLTRLLLDVLTGGKSAHAIVGMFGDFAWTLTPTFTPYRRDRPDGGTRDADP